MNPNSVMIGANNASNLAIKRDQIETKLKQQQETHNSNMEQNKQVKTMNDLKIETLEKALDQKDRQAFVKDSDEALDSWAEHGDITLFKNLKDNPVFTKTFGDVVDIQSVADLNDFDGQEDKLLLESGLTTAEIEKLSPEEKRKILHADGSRLAILTRPDGSKETTSVEELSAGTGRLSRADKIKKEMYIKAIHAGGAKRALALAEINGDEEMVTKLTETLDELSKYSSKATGGGKITKDMQNALFISGGDKEAARKIMKDKLITSKTRNLNEQAAIMDNADELAEEVSNGKLTVYSKAVLPAYNLETGMINKNKPLKKIMEDFSGTLDALTGFSRVAESIVKTGMTKNIATTLRDKVTAMSNKGIDNVSKMWTNTDDANKYVLEAEKYTKSKEAGRKLVNKELQIATLTLIKAMSGLAVSDDERKIYMKLTGADGTTSAREIFLSAMAFIGSKRATLAKQVGRIAGTAPIHAAQYTKQINDAMFKFDPEAPKSEKDKAAEAQKRAAREKASAKRISGMYKNFLEVGR